MSEGNKQGGAAFAGAPPFLTVEQAARWVGVSERTFQKMRVAGMVPAPVVLGPRVLRFVRSELDACVAAMPRQQAPAPEPAQLRSKRAAAGPA